MSGNTGLKLVGLALFLGLGLFLVLGRGGDASSRELQRDAAQPLAPDLPAEALESADDADAPTAAVTERVEATAGSPASITTPLKGELAGLLGRVVETDGTPVPGIEVALLEFDMELLFTPDTPDPESDAASLELEKTVTDEEGRFLLAGARAPAFHGLGIDLGGPRATLRVLDAALTNGDRTDVGDVVLAPYRVLTGRIVGEDGRGIPGARVRVATFPEEVLVARPYEFRGETLVGITNLISAGDGRGVIEPPPWVRAFVDQLPVPTTTSDEDGQFRLEGVPLARVIGGVDLPGYAGLPLGPLDMRGEGEEHLGDLVLTRGRTVQGVVEDAEGEPIAGVEVYAGAELVAGFAALLQPCGASDAEGRFSLRGVPEEGRVVAVTRRAKNEPWVGDVTSQHEGMLLSLETPITLTVRVQDEAGAPLSGAYVALTPSGKPGGGMMGFVEISRFLPRVREPETGFREVEAGRYVHSNLTPGTYDLAAHVAGRAVGREHAELWDEESEIVLTCPAGRTVVVSVVDQATGEPVPRARARILEATEAGFTRLDGANTDRDGRARLGPIGSSSGPGIDDESPHVLLVRHPRYADHSIALPEDQTRVAVALHGGGTLAGRVHLGGALPTQLYMLTLEYRGADGVLEIFNMPRFGLTDLEGAFRLDGLVAGEYRVELFERFLDEDPTGLMNEEFEPSNLFSETVTIEVGATTELVIDLTPTGRGPTARITGHVRVAGLGVAGADVSIDGNGSQRLTTDSWGRFDSGEISVRDNVWISVQGDVPLPSGETRRMPIFRESVELEEGETRRVEIDLEPVKIPVLVVEEGTGEPVADAEAVATMSGANWFWRGGDRPRFPTDVAGEAEVWVLSAGDYSVTVDAEGYATASRRVTAPEGGVAEVTRFEVTRAVPCAGRVAVQGHLATEGGFSFVSVRKEDDSVHGSMRLTGPEYAFELEGLTPGSYKAWLYVDGTEGEEQSFELGPDGNPHLVLDFVPSED